MRPKAGCSCIHLAPTHPCTLHGGHRCYPATLLANSLEVRGMTLPVSTQSEWCGRMGGPSFAAQSQRGIRYRWGSPASCCSPRRCGYPVAHARHRRQWTWSIVSTYELAMPWKKPFEYVKQVACQRALGHRTEENWRSEVSILHERDNPAWHTQFPNVSQLHSLPIIQINGKPNRKSVTEEGSCTWKLQLGSKVNMGLRCSLPEGRLVKEARWAMMSH